MAIDRRRFLLGLVGGFLGFAAPGVSGAVPKPCFVSGARDANGDFAVIIVDCDGLIKLRATLPWRAHGAACDGRRQWVIFSRRPGTAALAFQCNDVPRSQAFGTPDDRHFFGHGVFSPDGTLLYATENDYRGERGVIGVYDASNGFRRLGEMSSHGVGPHDILMMADGETLAVANGGILTHPDYGRAKLNLHDMKPSLVLMNRRDGQVRSHHGLAAEYSKLSIRHLAVDRFGGVCFGAQFQGGDRDVPPLVGHLDGSDLILLRAPTLVQARMRGYVGSVAVSADGSTLAATSPRGSLVAFWSTRLGQYLGAVSLEDVCGVAPLGVAGGFVLSSGPGKLCRAGRAGINGDCRTFDWSWDNHLSPVRAPWPSTA